MRSKTPISDYGAAVRELAREEQVAIDAGDCSAATRRRIASLRAKAERRCDAAILSNTGRALLLTAAKAVIDSNAYGEDIRMCASEAVGWIVSPAAMRALVRAVQVAEGRAETGA